MYLMLLDIEQPSLIGKIIFCHCFNPDPSSAIQSCTSLFCHPESDQCFVNCRICLQTPSPFLHLCKASFGMENTSKVDLDLQFLLGYIVNCYKIDIILEAL
uniref:Uncharacterized protein n=1 Tax=Arundo donax TaxID=35708 RepID=A0A0A9E1K8_ARUDO